MKLNTLKKHLAAGIERTRDLGNFTSMQSGQRLAHLLRAARPLPEDEEITAEAFPAVMRDGAVAAPELREFAEFVCRTLLIAGAWDASSVDGLRDALTTAATKTRAIEPRFASELDLLVRCLHLAGTQVAAPHASPPAPAKIGGVRIDGRPYDLGDRRDANEVFRFLVDSMLTDMREHVLERGTGLLAIEAVGGVDAARFLSFAERLAGSGLRGVAYLALVEDRERWRAVILAPCALSNAEHDAVERSLIERAKVVGLEVVAAPASLSFSSITVRMRTPIVAPMPTAAPAPIAATEV